VFAAGDTAAGTVLASDHIRSRYSYSVRIHALKLLAKFAPDTEGWGPRFDLLEQDSDPRIRYWMVGALQEVAITDADQRLQALRSREYDERVLRRLSQ
jgi:hypothetical protein